MTYFLTQLLNGISLGAIYAYQIATMLLSQNVPGDSLFNIDMAAPQDPLDCNLTNPIPNPGSRAPPGHPDSERRSPGFCKGGSEVGRCKAVGKGDYTVNWQKGLSAWYSISHDLQRHWGGWERLMVG